MMNPKRFSMISGGSGKKIEKEIDQSVVEFVT